MAFNYTSVESLTEVYQRVIDRYQARWVDFDLENELGNAFVAIRRAKAIKQLQINNPTLRVSITVPVSPTGLTVEGLAFVKLNNYTIDVLNIMTFDYAYDSITPGVSMGTYAVNAAKATWDQVKTLPHIKSIGITAMIGKSDTNETFDQTDAQYLVNNTINKPYVSVRKNNLYSYS